MTKQEAMEKALHRAVNAIVEGKMSGYNRYMMDEVLTQARAALAMPETTEATCRCGHIEGLHASRGRQAGPCTECGCDRFAQRETTEAVKSERTPVHECVWDVRCPNDHVIVAGVLSPQAARAELWRRCLKCGDMPTEDDFRYRKVPSSTPRPASLTVEQVKERMPCGCEDCVVAVEHARRGEREAMQVVERLRELLNCLRVRHSSYSDDRPDTVSVVVVNDDHETLRLAIRGAYAAIRTLNLEDK